MSLFSAGLRVKMFGVRGCSARHLFYCMLTAGALLLCYRALVLWPSPAKPEVVSLWGPSRTRNISVYTRPHQPTALLRPREPCIGDEFLVVVVPSASGNIEQRTAIRSTWGQWIAGDPQVSTAQGQRRSLQAQTEDPVSEEDKPLREPLEGDEGSAVTEPYYVIWDEYLDKGIEGFNSSSRNKRQSLRSEKPSTPSTPRPLTGRKVYRSSLKTYFGQIDESLRYKLVFLLGRDLHWRNTNKDIIAEHARYGDILLEDFVDSYQNLTLKTMFLLKYMNDSCPKARFVAKVDDDMFLHVPNLQKTLLDKTLPKKLILGCLFCNVRPISNPWSKWYSPSYMFKGNKFPNYLSGTSYVMSVNLMEPLLEASATTPLFHLEDVYTTGILAKKIGVRPHDNIGFSYQTRPINPCLYQNVTVAHEVEPGPMYKLWNLLHLEVIVRACKPLIAPLIRHYKPSGCKWD